MPKAGSSTIQAWLARNADNLRDQGIMVVSAALKDGGFPAFTPHENGSINSGWLADRAIEAWAQHDATVGQGIIDALAEAAEEHGTIVVTGESFAHAFWSLHKPTLDAFEALSESHDVRIAYYARPQHIVLEAAWKQWGFRSELAPSAYVATYADHLRYASTAHGVAKLAPSLGFEPRPLREDLLDQEDLITDFGGRFLGIEARSDGEWANRGLPLELAIMLRAAPPGMFWATTDDNARLDKIKRLFAGPGASDDERLNRSRLVLRQHAYERFAEENARLGWNQFVPKPSEEDRAPGIDALDLLWRPSASEAELAVFFNILNSAISLPGPNASE